jgi:polysaccharide export outer membrane protein
MRSSRFIALTLVAATLTGCMHAGGPFARNAAPPWARPAPVAMVAPAGPAPVVVEPIAPVEPVAIVAPAPGGGGYRLDSGDKLRVVVFGQEGLSNSYTVDPSGSITMPLIGAVPARGSTTAGLQQAIAARLRQGFIREPHVAVEVEAYRPFLKLGVVAIPGP